MMMWTLMMVMVVNCFSGTSVRDLAIANLRHAASRFLTYAESEFRLC